MIYELKDTDKAKPLFAGWEETLIYSCLQRVMGTVYVTNIENPLSACAYVGCFAFYGGEPEEELVRHKPKGFVIMTPQTRQWAELIEACYPAAKKAVRYAIRKDTVFDKDKLREMASWIPEGYEMHHIDGELYDLCLKSPIAGDFVSSFSSKEQYLKDGRGIVILKNREIVAGASSYTRYLEGIEIEVDTAERERRKHLATAACSALILECLNEGLYPSWDAQNLHSVRLAEKLGYEFSHEYTVYEVTDD